MLVLSRKPDETIVIGQNIKVTILRVQGRIVKLGVEAPENISVFRSELLGRPSPRRRGATGTAGEDSDEDCDASEDSPTGAMGCECLAPRDRIAPGEPLHRRAGRAPASLAP